MILAFSLVVLIVKKSKYLKLVLPGVAILVIVSAIGIYLSLHNAPCFLGRYITCIMPWILFAVAAAIGEFRTKAVGIAVLLLAMAAGALVYRDRLRYEYEKGLEYIHENFDEEEDAIIYADLHSNFLSIFAPEYYTYIFGYEDDFNPYDNDEVFTKAEQMEQVKGSLYFICLNDKNPDWFMKSDYEQVYGFHYLVYDFSVYRILEIH